MSLFAALEGVWLRFGMNGELRNVSADISLLRLTFGKENVEKPVFRLENRSKKYSRYTLF